MWHRRRTLRVCPLRSTFFARIGHLGPWKASSHKRHQFPPQFSIFPPNLNSFGEAGEATNYLLFTAVPLYQWTLAWPHEKCLPPQSSSFSVHHSTVRTSAVRFLGPNERPDSSASISRFSFFPPVSQSRQEFSPSLSSAKKDFDESVIAQFYLIVSIALKHKPSFALSDLVRSELFCLSLRWETLDVTHLWSPSVTEPLPMLCFVSPPCEEVLLLHTCINNLSVFSYTKRFDQNHAPNYYDDEPFGKYMRVCQSNAAVQWSTLLPPGQRIDSNSDLSVWSLHVLPVYSCVLLQIPQPPFTVPRFAH